MGAVDQLLEQFPQLSPRLQQAARFIADHPNEVVIGSMRALADKAGALPVTLVRLAQQLGYAGWPELKAAFAEDLGLNSERYGQRARKLAARGADNGLVDELFGTLSSNLDVTRQQAGPELLKAAKLLRQAGRVHVAGFRASFPIAYSLFYGYRLFRNSVTLLDGHAGSLEMQFRAIDSQDVLFVVSFAPYSREAMQAIGVAREVGAKVIALTDSLTSPLALSSDLAMVYSATSPSFFPSVTAAVAVTEALLELLAADRGKAAARRMEAAEQSLYESGAYLEAPRAL